MTSTGKPEMRGKAAPSPNSTDPTMKVLAIHQPESRGAHSTRGWKNWRNITSSLGQSCEACPRPSDPGTKEQVVQLSTQSLASLAGDIAVPDYDRAGISPGITHIGVGNFHR